VLVNSFQCVSLHHVDVLHYYTLSFFPSFPPPLTSSTRPILDTCSVYIILLEFFEKSGLRYHDHDSQKVDRHLIDILKADIFFFMDLDLSLGSRFSVWSHIMLAQDPTLKSLECSVSLAMCYL
jgi:hypothetical protein